MSETEKLQDKIKEMNVAYEKTQKTQRKPKVGKGRDLVPELEHKPKDKGELRRERLIITLEAIMYGALITLIITAIVAIIASR